MGNLECLLPQVQAKMLSDSCTAHALNALKPEQKSTLRQAIAAVKTDLIKAADFIQAQKNRNRDQMNLLKAEIKELKTGNSNIPNFRVAFDAAIVSCADAAAVFDSSKSLTDQLYTASIELNYRLGVKQIIDTTLSLEVQESQETLKSLDDILYILG
jgi:hypothetical protein